MKISYKKILLKLKTISYNYFTGLLISLHLVSTLLSSQSEGLKVTECSLAKSAATTHFFNKSSLSGIRPIYNVYEGS